MKRSFLFGALMVILSVTVTSLSAQTQNTTTSTSTNYIQTSKLIGTTVRSSQGEAIGEIKDVVLDNNGCMAYTVVSTGGTGSRITGQSKSVAVPWAVYSTTSDPRVVTVRVEKEKIYNAPVFEYSRINEYSTSGWINNVYSHYGVSASIGAGTQSSVTGATTTTGTSTATTAGSTTAVASPATSALPTATASASVTPSPSPAVSASPSATASESAHTTATPSPADTMSTRPPKPIRGSNRESATQEESPSGKTKASVTPSSSSHHHTGAASEKSEESKSESTSRPSSGKRKSSRKGATEESTEPSATPKVSTEQE